MERKKKEKKTDKKKKRKKLLDEAVRNSEHGKPCQGSDGVKSG